MRKTWFILLLLMTNEVMADRTEIAPINAPGLYPTAATTITFTAADTSNLNASDLSGKGKDLLLVYNSGASEHNYTVTSASDPLTGRSGNISIAIPAGAYHVYGPLALDGWRQSDGMLYYEGDHAEVKFLLLKLP